MQHALFFVQQNLRHALARAIEQAKSEPESADSFFKALNQSLSWFTFTLPSLLPIDWITRSSILPFASEFRLEKKWGTQQVKPRISHPLIREIKKGKLILAHPLKHIVKSGDSLWQIAQSVRSGSVNAATIRKWNLLPDDTIQPGQALWLCNPDDTLVKDIGRHFKKESLTAKNPAIPIDRLSPKIANKYVGLERQQYLLMVKLSFKGKLSENIHPMVVAAQQGANNNPFSSYFAVMEKQPNWLKPKPLQEFSGFKALVQEQGWPGYPQTRHIKPPTAKAIPLTNLNQVGAVAQESWELALGCLVTTGDFMNGAANAISSNATTIPSVYGGTVSIVMRENRSSEAFTLGQQFGDTFSLVQGLVEGVAGAMTALGGGGAAIITSPTVVGAVAGTTVAAGGVFIAAHGMNTAQNAVENLFGERKRSSAEALEEPEVAPSKPDKGNKVQKKAIDDVESGKTKLKDYGEKPGNFKRQGNYGEMKMDRHFENIDEINGKKVEFKRISSDRVVDVDQKVARGIDGVYENAYPPPKYVIAESKYESSQLNKKTGQMGDKWIEKNLENAVGESLADEIISTGYERVLIHIDKTGKITTKAINSTGKLIGVWP